MKDDPHRDPAEPERDRDSGAGMVEYGLLTAVIVVLVIAMGAASSGLIESLGGAVETVSVVTAENGIDAGGSK